MFKGREMVIATKHGKEKVLAPILERELGVKVIVPENFDTDRFGTFTDEVKREDDPLTTARKKCFAGMEATGCSLAIGSEGSFGPHPQLFFAACNEELLLLVDKENDLEISCLNVSLQTNYGREIITGEEQLLDFAAKCLFPSHLLILKITDSATVKFIKGISTWHDLLIYYRSYTGLKIEAETDMRAMHNPTRMEVIEQTAQKLVDKVQSYCPQCHLPGFGVVSSVPGLPCQLCGTPTHSVLNHRLKCSKCSYTENKPYPNGRKYEDPQFCLQCNP